MNESNASHSVASYSSQQQHQQHQQSNNKPRKASKKGPPSVVFSNLTGSSTNNTSSTNTYTRQYITRAKDSLLNNLIMLKDKSAQKDWKYFVLTLFVVVYTSLCSVVMGVQGSFNQGEYGDWIWRAANFIITFSLDLLPYEGMMSLAIICMIVSFGGIVLYFLAFRFTRRARYLFQFKMAIKIYGTLTSLCSFVMIYILSSFYDCNYSKYVKFTGYSMPQPVLSRFPTHMCHDTPTIILMIFSIFSILCLIVMNCIFSIILSNSHVLNRAMFIVETPTFSIMILTISELQLAIMYFIPQSFIYIRSILHIVPSVLLIPILFYSLPYFKRVENSIMSGVCFAKCLAPVGSLVSYFANSANDRFFGLGLAFLPLALIIGGFLIGFTIMEIYTRIVIWGIRKDIMFNFDSTLSDPENIQRLEKEAPFLVKDMETTKRMRSFEMFIKFSILSKSNISGTQLRDRDLGVAIVKSMTNHKSFTQADILCLAGILVAYFWEEEFNRFGFASAMLKRAFKNKSSILQDLIYRERIMEIEIASEQARGVRRSIADIVDVLVNLQTKQRRITALHKAFWKCLMEEVVNYNTVSYITRTITRMTRECIETFFHLIKNYRHERSIKRLYARFIEEVLFDFETANEIYEETEENDEDDTKHQSGFMELKQHTSKSRNRVYPYVAMSPKDKTKSSLDLTGLNGGTTELVENAEELDLKEAAEDEANKREFLIRAAISTPPNNLHVYVLFWIFIGVICCLFLGGIALAVYYQTSSTSDLPIIHNSCLISSLPLEGLSSIRNFQVYLTLFSNQSLNEQSSVIGNITQFEENHNSRLQYIKEKLLTLESLALENEMTTEMQEDYSNPIYDIIFPLAATSGDFTSYEIRKNSISLITKTIVKELEIFHKMSHNDYFNTTTSFSFMTMWRNRLLVLNNYKHFCNIMIDRAHEDNLNLDNLYFYYYIASCSFLVIAGMIITSIFIFNTRKLFWTIKTVDKCVPKDCVGKLYTQMKSSDEDNMVMNMKDSSPFKRPSFQILVFSILLLVLVIASLSIFLYRVKAVVGFTEDILNNINTSADVLSNANVALFDVGQLLSQAFITANSSSINSDKIISDKEISGIYDDVDDVTDELFRDWSQLVFGNLTTNDKPMLGIFPQVDRIITGECSGNETSTEQTQCVGLNTLVSEFVLSSYELKENVKLPKKDPNAYFLTFQNMKNVAIQLESQLYNFVDIYLSSVINNEEETIIGFVSAFGLIFFVILGYGLFSAIETDCYETHTVRSLLNYIPIEILDGGEDLRNFIFYHQLYGSFSLKSNKSKGTQSQDEESKVKCIINASVDGTVLCNHYHDIELFNPSCQRMFGRQPSEVVGRPFYTLFDPKYHETIKTMMKSMEKVSDNNAGLVNCGESKEVECVRKNFSTFPASISIACAYYNSKQIFTCSIKDITSEKKQNALLADEKKRADNLLRNVLPNGVAQRLKAVSFLSILFLKWILNGY